MQLPLVTLCGRAFASRMAGRLLTAIGADAGVAATPEEYQRIAVSLANDPARYQRYKAVFTENAWGETMGDVARFTAEYEATLMRVRLAP
jgi:predicted O-linked N-acetylglucosamine transferase (SPINDLY family)